MADSSTVVDATQPSTESASAPELNATNSTSNSTNNNTNTSGKKTVDDYEFIRVLGEGSYATVIIELIII